MNSNSKHFATYPFHSVEEEKVPPKVTPQTSSPSYRLAFYDQDFLLKEENRPVRLHLEYLKPEMMQQEQKINSTIVVFGSARLPDPETALSNLENVKEDIKRNPGDPGLQKLLAMAEKDVEKSRYYEEARRLGRIISTTSQVNGHHDFVVVTGGGPGIMEAANRGANDVGAKSIALNVLLPNEQVPNPYSTPELSFNFHYFALRKMHLLLRARAAVFFPGGYGTLDELFETLTLMQTKKIERMPVILFCKDYWDKIVNFEALATEGMIDHADLNLFEFVETAEQGWKIISDYYELKK
jgi:uncharacterized protein (TIGR00730 family)